MASLEGVSLEFTAADRSLLSSVRGFSQPNRVQIRSLKELLETIRPLGLEFFQGHTLQEQQFLGEGISYKVFKCLHRQSQRVVAVKQIKLPLVSSQESFDRQVACVLRDIEVMSHPTLARHDNILNIVGYGWGFRESGSIPFLVTEYATSGTMRDFLRAYSLSSREKLFLCENVARGLHELHLCGMVHGDLKLDNVLVTPYTSAASTLNSTSSQTVVAKIADFGHSLLLYGDDDAKEVQTYGGTLAYNAPEISKCKTAGYENLNFRKCDVWALGLLCWEALDNGASYYKSPRIQELIAFSKTDSRSASVNSESTSKVTTESILENLVFVAAKLQDVTRQFLYSDTVKDLYSFDRTKAQELFQATLEADPDKRVADIPMLPLLLKSKTRTNRRKLGQTRTKLAEWSFEVFRPKQIAKIPHVVRVQIFDDCRRLGSEPGCSIASARAAFHVSLAYFLGFGTEVDIHHGIEWASKSSFKGFQTASTFQELIEEAFLYDDTIGSCCSQERYRRFICEAFRKVDIPYLDAVPIKSSLTFEELVALRNANQHEAELTVSHWIEFPFVHYTVLYGLTSFLTPDDNINFVEPIMGETPLLLACRLGNTPAVRDLLLLGADCTISANDGCLPIHWLWMFPPEDIKFMATILLFPDQATGQYLASTVEGATLTRNFSSRSYTSHPSPVPPMSASSSTYESSKLKNAGILGFEFQLFRHKLAANKVFATAKGLARHKLISSISGRRYLDPQVPLQLVGTPLQFAIGVASKEAVDVLLYFGADPTFDSSVWLKLERDNWRDRSAIHLAASLHMANFLEMFRDLFVSRVDFFHSSWPAIAESSPFERTLIHGRHSLQAARDTIAFLRDNSFEPSLLHPRQVITNQRIIEVASEVHDFAILVAGLPQPELMGDESLGYQLSSADRDFLMLQCTKAACSGAYGLGKSMELLEFALSRGCSVDTSQDEIQEVRAFNIAIQYHRTEILDWFLEKGVNIKALDDSGSSPLHHMINSGFPGTSHLIKLLEAGADPNARGPLGATPLHVAVKNLNIKQASILLEHGADLTIPAIADYDPANSGESNTKCSILHCAVDTGSVELVSLILKYRDLRYPARADTLSWKDSQGNTPLLLAALRGDANMVNIILDNGEDRSVRNANDFNCLHAAASGLHGGVLSILAKKSDVNAVVRPTGETPLHLVFRASQDPASNLSLSCIMVLIDAGADMMICDHFGITFMDLVWSHFPRTDRADQTYIENRRKVLNKMTEQGCGISFDSHSNATMPMLHAAVAARNEGCIEELLMLGASVGILDSIGRTPLHRCASMGSRHDQTLSRHLDQKLYRVAELLIKGGADIYGLDAQGCIPLEIAIHSHNVPITTILLYRHKLGNGLLSVGASDVKITDSISEVTNYLAPSTKRNGGVVESIKKLLPVRKVKDIVTESPSLEVRLKNVAGVDRQILLKAWLLSIHVENWSCTSVFLQLGLFENTVLLKWPLGLGVLKYALEEEIGAVLIQFMGNLSQDPDPVLGDNWQHVVKMNEKWLAKNLGEHLIHRLTQLIKTKAYTPILDLESLRERDYIEAQNTSMIEVIPQVESPAQITLFNLEDEEEDYGLDEDIQFKLNKLIEKWKRNEGSFF